MQSPGTVDLFGTLACVADPGLGLVFVDVSNPSAPRNVTNYTADGMVWNMTAASSNRLFVCAQTNSPTPYHIVLLDLSEPSKPRALSRLRSESFTSMRSWNDYLFGSQGRYGLTVLDFSNPAKPGRVGHNSSFHEANGLVFAADSQIVLAAGPDGLGVLQMHPFFTGVSRTGQDITLQWDSFGPARLQRTTTWPNARWDDVPNSESTNAASLPATAGSGFFRLLRHQTSQP